MPEPSWTRVKEVFADVIERVGADRQAYLDASCAGDPALRARVESLLAAGSHGERFLSAPRNMEPESIGIMELKSDSNRGEGSGACIGSYTLVDLVGEGGVGRVFSARQEQPIQRTVAVKIVKPGMDSRAVIARFEQERQALAVMDHPGVAKVHDAGVTALGHPYFVMEFVRGERITTYCDQHRLTIRQRLELFIPVCEAVQHAHMKGIIHRDIKPSNVLVTEQDGRPAPKIIDFGIAKAITNALTEKTIFTEHGMLIGTPEYMSPEQAAMGAMDIDTRTDVYSLGVLLYELLAGVLPFDSKMLREKGFDEVRRLIREEEPPTPSTRLTKLADAAAIEVATCRQAERDGLTRQLRRELEWVPLKAMRKERDQRYRTPAELADDIKNYLAGRALVAGPESRIYQARKFVRRHRAVLAGAGSFALMLVAATAVSTYFGMRAAAARVETQTALDHTRMVADFEADMLKQINVWQMGSGLFHAIQDEVHGAMQRRGDPIEAIEAKLKQLDDSLSDVNPTTVAASTLDQHILASAVSAINSKFQSQPLVRAQLLETVAAAYSDMGYHEKALIQQGAVLETRRSELGDEHPDTISAMENMGVLLHRAGKLPQAEEYLGKVLTQRRNALGVDDPKTLIAINNMGLLLLDLNQIDEAALHFKEALEHRSRMLGDNDPGTLTSTDNLGFALMVQRKFAEAEPYLKKALDGRRRALGDDHPDTLVSIHNYGLLCQWLGKPGDAALYYEEAMKRRRRVLGDDNPQTQDSVLNLGAVLRAQNKLPEAEPYYREALERSRRTLGNDHPMTLIAVNNMASLLRLQHKAIEAEPLYREAVEGLSRAAGPDHWQTGAARMGLGRTLLDLTRFAEAAEQFIQSERVLRSARGGPPVNHANCIAGLVELYEKWHAADPGQGHDAQAARWRDKLQELKRAAEGEKAASPDTK